MKAESPTVIATRLGLAWHRGGAGETLTWDCLLTLAVKAYWKRRCEKRAA